MLITKHATGQAQRRGFTVDLIDIIYDYGTKSRRPGNAKQIMITKKNKRRLAYKNDDKQVVQLLDKINSKALLMSNDNTLITTYIKY